MKRRLFLGLLTAISIATPSFADDVVLDYTPNADPIAAALADGKSVLVDYAAVWCSTCATQERIISGLRADNPKYNDIVFVRVDWDDYRNAPITTDSNIPRRSTLVMLQGDKELGRIVAGTRKADIQALLDLGLSMDAS